MSVLVTTLRALLDAADEAFDQGRLSAATAAYADLLERAQERSDASVEIMARAMLALCALRVRDVDAASEQIEAARRRLGQASVPAQARFHRADMRRLAEAQPWDQRQGALRAYLAWAEESRAPEAVLDACVLLAAGPDLDDRVDWLEYGIDHAVAHGVRRDLGRAYVHLASALDQSGRTDAALEAYRQALACHERDGDARSRVGAGWAVGALACRVEDWPLARHHLEQALALAERTDGCGDYEPLILGELAGVYEAAGDVIEARKLVLRGLRLGREQELPVFAPRRYQWLRDVAVRLEVG